MEIIVPAAGLSSRFPNMKPKYLLASYDKRIMLQLALEQYIGKHNITIGILREHQDEYNSIKHIAAYLGDRVNVVVLDELTRGPAETVYQIIKKAGINLTSPILIKDCDSFFNHEETGDNYICVSKIDQHDVLKKLYSKSFVVSNDQDIVQNIVEKSVVSDTFCVGGYKFKSAELFCNAFEKLKNVTHEIFVSHIIQQCLDDGEVFVEKPITDYSDVGTFSDWFEYNDKPVFFCDIDGTIVKAQDQDDNDKPVTPLINNVKALLEWQRKGAQFIFVTARKSNNTETTEKMLKSLGFENFRLLTGLHNARRVVINDYNTANPYPRAEAINIIRDNDNLKDFL
jgi:hypothetical protein